MPAPGDGSPDYPRRIQSAGQGSGTVVTTATVVMEEIRYDVTVTSARRPACEPNVVSIVLDRARSLISVMVVATFVLTFMVQPFRIPSESMERTLLVGDFLLVNKVIYSPAGPWKWLLPYRGPEHGDIVVFHFPLDPDDHVVKRLIGEDGDRLHLRDSVVYRDGQPLTEPYTRQAGWLQDPGRDSFRDNFPASRFTDPGVDSRWWAELQHNVSQGDLVVPREKYFVLGDNRNDSRDSRYWGFVPRANLVGMPVLVYFSVREPSRTDRPSMPAPMQDDRLGNSAVGRMLRFARWERTLRVVQ